MVYQNHKIFEIEMLFFVVFLNKFFMVGKIVQILHDLFVGEFTEKQQVDQGVNLTYFHMFIVFNIVIDLVYNHHPKVSFVIMRFLLQVHLLLIEKHPIIYLDVYIFVFIKGPVQVVVQHAFQGLLQYLLDMTRLILSERCALWVSRRIVATLIDGVLIFSI